MCAIGVIGNRIFPQVSLIAWPKWDTVCPRISQYCLKYTPQFVCFSLKDDNVQEVFQANGPKLIIVQICRSDTWLL